MVTNIASFASQSKATKGKDLKIYTSLDLHWQRIAIKFFFLESHFQ